MNEIIVLIVSQLSFSFSRTLNVRYISQENIPMSLITSAFIKSTWLITTAIGVKSMINYDWVILTVFVVSGLVGDYFSFFVKIPVKTKKDERK